MYSNINKEICNNINYKQIKHGKYIFDISNVNYYKNPLMNGFKLSSYDVSTTEIEDKLEDLRNASSLQRIIRKEIKPILKAGLKYNELMNYIQDRANELCSTHINSGLGYPVGISVNNVMAHDSSYNGDKRTFKNGDIVKLDFGIHMNGNIIDTAKTYIIGDDTKSSIYQPLLDATQDATYTCIKNCRVDMRLYSLSEIISEIITSYEITFKNGTTQPVKPVLTLGGHNILPYRIHGGKLILSHPSSTQQNMKIEENDLFAIETFATTGYGLTSYLDNTTHYMLNNLDRLQQTKYNEILNKCQIKNNLIKYNTMPFHIDWCCQNKQMKKELDMLVKLKYINSYPPVQETNALTSQLEHTIFVKNYGVEILTIDDDY